MQRRRSLVAFAVLAALGSAHVAMAAMPDSVTWFATAPIIGADEDQATTRDGATQDGIVFRPAVATIANDTLGAVRLDTGSDDTGCAHVATKRRRLGRTPHRRPGPRCQIPRAEWFPPCAEARKFRATKRFQPIFAMESRIFTSR